MALVLNDRVRETTTTTGTGAVALGGAVSGFETFAAGIGNSNTVYYAIVHRTAAEFEVGLGTLDGDSSDLTRTTVISSSNSDSAVNFASGTKDVFCTLPASKTVFEDASGHVTLPHDLFIEGGLIDLKNDGGAVSQIKFYCESSNAHAQTLIGAPHSESASNTLTLPSSGGDAKLVSVSSTATLTNKTLTSPTINGATIGSDNLATASNGDINIAPNGTGKVVIRGNTNQGKIVLNCESNSHGQTIIAAPHSEAANNVLTLPSTGGDARLVSTASTATLTNKTLTSPKINEDVAVTSTATEINILDGVTATTAELNIMDGVTATTAELNIMDGVTATTAELNIMDGVTATTAELNIMDGVTSTAAELNILDGVTSTTAELNILDGVTSTTAELNILDGVTSTATELNIMDGNTSASSTTVADADRVVFNDNGTMKQVAMTDISTYTDAGATALAIALG